MLGGDAGSNWRDEGWEILAPVLLHIQSNLGGNLSLTRLARVAGWAPHHFHRRFRALVGETVRRYVERLRLERAAYSLVLHHARILDVALEVGYRSHETFTRAFTRRFGASPATFRAEGAARMETAVRPSADVGEDVGFGLSATRVTRVGSLRLASIRHVGPYEDVGDEPYDILWSFLEERGWLEGAVFLGIGYDAPGITRPEQLRYDAAALVPQSFAPQGAIAYQVLEGFLAAHTTFVGSFREIGRAYEEIFPRASTIEGHRFVGLPAVEIYRASRVRAEALLQQTEIYLPIEPIGSSAAPGSEK